MAVIFYNRLGLSPFRRYVLPVLGIISIAIPFWALIQPGQPAPYNLFPWIVLAMLIVAAIYAWWKVRSDPELPGRIGAFGVEQPIVEAPAGGSKLDADAL